VLRISEPGSRIAFVPSFLLLGFVLRGLPLLQDLQDCDCVSHPHFYSYERAYRC
jgi:hypothetical protein